MSSPESTEVSTEFLREHPLFKGVEENDLERFTHYFGRALFNAGDTIIHEGERGDCLYVLMNGTVEVLKKIVADEKVNFERIALLEAGDTFGEMEFIDQQPRSASIRAVDDTVVLILAESTLWKVAEEDQKAFTRLILNLAKEISIRLRRTDAYFAGSLFTLKQK